MIKYFDSLTPAKKHLDVLILGSYSESCFKQLEILRTSLNEYGYDKVSLVAEHTEETTELEELSFTNYPLYAYKKSLQCIEKSQVNLFVFFKDCPFGSVISEMIISILKFGQLSCATIFLQNGIKFDNVPLGFLFHYNINICYFDDIKVLIRLSKQECNNHLIIGKYGQADK